MILDEKQISAKKYQHKFGMPLTSFDIYDLLETAEHYRAKSERLGKDVAKLRQGNLFGKG